MGHMYYNNNPIAGAERYRSITTSHIRNADGAYIVYDVCNEISFKSVEFWHDCIKNSTDEEIVVYLIGNKSDLIYEEGRIVEKHRAVSFVKSKALQGFTECSAKTNENIAETFQQFYKSIFNQHI